MAWFDPNATTASWFAPQPGNAAVAASPAPPADTSFLFQPPGQPSQAGAPGIAPAPGSDSGPGGFGLPPGALSALSALGRGVGNFGDSGFNLGMLGGPLSLASAASQGNVPGEIGGGLSTAGSLGTLAGFPGVGAAAGGLGGLLSLGTGIQGLLSGKASPGQSAMSLGGGAMSTYGALSSLFPSVFPSLTAALGNAIGASSSTALGAGVGAGAGELGAGLTGGIVAAPALLIAIADMVGKMQDSARVQSFVPEFKQQIASIPNVLSAERAAYPTLAGLGSQTTPEQALAALKQFQGAQSQYQNTGLEGLLKYGQGGPAGDFGQGSMFKFNASDNVLNALRSPTAANLLGELRAQDILGRSGYTPAQIPGYMGPEAFALALNGAQNTAGQQGIPQSNANGSPFSGTLGSILRPGGLQVDPATGQGELGPPTGYESTPSGVQNSALLAQINALKPGGMEQGLVNLLQSYGGINPLFSPFGMLTPNLAPSKAIAAYAPQPSGGAVSPPSTYWNSAP